MRGHAAGVITDDLSAAVFHVLTDLMESNACKVATCLEIWRNLQTISAMQLGQDLGTIPSRHRYVVCLVGEARNLEFDEEPDYRRCLSRI